MRLLPNKLVANLPYAVAATVVLDYFERFASLESATVMVQKEVADRMAASPGTKNYGAYTVKLRLYAEPAGRFAVGPGNFFPPPRVESAVLRLNRRPVFDDQGVPLDADAIAAPDDGAGVHPQPTEGIDGPLTDGVGGQLGDEGGVHAVVGQRNGHVRLAAAKGGLKGRALEEALQRGALQTKHDFTESNNTSHCNHS